MAKASSPRDGHGTAQLAASTVAQAAAELPLALTDAQAESLARFAALLAKWNRVHNLTARESAGDLLVLHLLDSLSIVEPLRAALAPRLSITGSFNVLDVGSGGGLPGIPLAIVEPRAHVTLVDKVAKKVAFLQQARTELRLSNVECVAARIEQFDPPTRYDVVTSRAFASLSDFVAGSRHLLADDGFWAAMKGAMPQEEIAALPPEVAVRDIVKLRVPRLDAERHLVFLQARKPR